MADLLDTYYLFLVTTTDVDSGISKLPQCPENIETPEQTKHICSDKQ